MKPSSVIIFYKPYGVLSQFRREGNWETLADYGPFPRSLYPAGRLDVDSEGLLVLTDDNEIKQRLTEPRYRHPRTYLAQVEGTPAAGALERLRRGIPLEGKHTRQAHARLLDAEPPIAPRRVPIRIRRTIPTAWLELTLTEGRNRQVRRMTAAVGYPTLRLIRTHVGVLTLKGLRPGEWRVLAEGEMRRLRSSLGMEG